MTYKEKLNIRILKRKALSQLLSARTSRSISVTGVRAIEDYIGALEYQCTLNEKLLRTKLNEAKLELIFSYLLCTIVTVSFVVSIFL